MGKGLLTIGTGVLLLYSTINSGAVMANDRKEELQKPKQESVATENVEKTKNCRFIGNIFGEGAVLGGELYDPTRARAFLSANFMYNMSNSRKIAFGPVFKFNIGFNGNEDFFWDRYAKAVAGFGIKIDGLSLGVGAGYKHYFDDILKSGEFAEIWADYWNRWEGNNLSDSKTFPMRPRTTLYLDAYANTLIDNIETMGRLEQGLLVFNGGGFKVIPFGAGKINYDLENKPWNRYGELEAGLKLSKGDFVVGAKYGNRWSFNDGLEGNYWKIFVQFWKGIETSCR